MLNRWLKRGQNLLASLDELACDTLLNKPTRLSAKARCLSVSFDDVPLSGAERGAAILECHQSRGTFYSCFGLAGKNTDSGILADDETLLRLSTRGHEIGCHTHSHLNLASAPRSLFETDLDANFERARTLGISLRNFAYPYGRVSLRNKAAIRSRFTSARGITQGIVRDRFDASNLPSFSLQATTDIELIMRAIDQVDEAGGWLIIYSHDVDPNPSRWGVTAERLHDIVSAARGRDIDVLTVDEVMRRYSIEEASTKPAFEHAR